MKHVVQIVLNTITSMGVVLAIGLWFFIGSLLAIPPLILWFGDCRVMAWWLVAAIIWITLTAIPCMYDPCKKRNV